VHSPPRVQRLDDPDRLLGDPTPRRKQKVLPVAQATDRTHGRAVERDYERFQRRRLAFGNHVREVRRAGGAS
jgi:hypothetical protein